MISNAARVRLAQAERLLAGTALPGVWPRCAAWLIRLALEKELDALWARHSPQLIDCSRRSQLLALGVVADAQTQHHATELWNTLSRAAHHHHYELAPTAAELRGWLDGAALLCMRLSRLI